MPTNLAASAQRLQEHVTTTDVGQAVHRTTRCVLQWEATGKMPRATRLPSGRLIWPRETIEGWLRELEAGYKGDAR
jgi:hypothetical protein